MQGLMMDTPLLISSLMRFADANYPDREIVSVTVENPQQRYTYREAFVRTRKLANALKRLGVEAGERVGTLVWNDHRHFELYYALSGSGIVCHTIDPNGVMQITDRTKDVIKSGGEWISSIDLENAAVDHPGVAEAAVIGRYHPKWTERPQLIVVSKDGEEIAKDEMLAWFDGRVATWWKPNDVVFVDELPHTATGKINKLALREQFADYRFP